MPPRKVAIEAPYLSYLHARKFAAALAKAGHAVSHHLIRWPPLEKTNWILSRSSSCLIINLCSQYLESPLSNSILPVYQPNEGRGKPYGIHTCSIVALETKSTGMREMPVAMRGDKMRKSRALARKLLFYSVQLQICRQPVEYVGSKAWLLH